MAMATKIDFLGYVAWLRGIDVSEKSAVFSWILTFKFDVSIKKLSYVKCPSPSYVQWQSVPFHP
jgi:hypothetical protein